MIEAVIIVFLSASGQPLEVRGPYQMTMKRCDAVAEITAKMYAIPPIPPGYDPRTRSIQCFPWKGRRA